MCSCNKNERKKSLLSTKRILWADLIVKALFLAYFPSTITALCCVVLSIPSALALFGIHFGKQRGWLYPALIHHTIFYLLPLGLFVGLFFAGLAFRSNWSESPMERDPAQYCSVWLDYTGHESDVNNFGEAASVIVPKLKAKCDLPVPLNPFWYKGDLPLPKCPPVALLARSLSVNASGWWSSTIICSYVPTMNMYQWNLTIFLVPSGLLVFLALHILQMFRFIRLFNLGHKMSGADEEEPPLLSSVVGGTAMLK